MATLHLSIPNGEFIAGLSERDTFTVTADVYGEADTAGARAIWCSLIDYPATSLTDSIDCLIDMVDEAIGECYEMEERPTSATIPENERELYDWLKRIQSVSPKVEVQYQG